ncbi:uncharacterized protein LOC117125571 [Anneissia japonica]|uniref:uncharacterized protein LOC117125571 n=1 Tax=Anneissia japonica TaxID=1529436 RepID=UPI001425BA38|nr:uncharacterized protein LOC117125571 [Anneissia japonica]XP_033127994.1 uncharacterized protein LOC117125571 [Anneissia japonica]XP_033128001.1 uncharacterized protein LOC117125571 [Anneissia japonica]
MVLFWYFTETYEAMAEVYVMMSAYSNHLHNVSLKRISDKMTEAQANAAVCCRMIQHLCPLVPIPDYRANPYVDVVVHYGNQILSFGVHEDSTIEEVVQLVLPGQTNEVVVVDENWNELQFAMRVGINRVLYIYS